MLVERKLLNKAWKNFRQYNRELKEFSQPWTDFHVFLGVDRFWLRAWASEIDTIPGHFKADLTPLQLGKLNALANCNRDNVYFLLRVAIARYKDHE